MGETYAKQDPFDPATVLAESSRRGPRRARAGRLTACLSLICKASMARYARAPFSPASKIFQGFPGPPLPLPRSTAPLFFTLFPGYSPSKEIEVYARSVGHTPEAGSLTLISMGQGQEGPAEAVLDR